MVVWKTKVIFVNVIFDIQESFPLFLASQNILYVENRNIFLYLGSVIRLRANKEYWSNNLYEAKMKAGLDYCVYSLN